MAYGDYSGRSHYAVIIKETSDKDHSDYAVIIKLLIFFSPSRTDWLDGKHVVFGHVISGLDVTKKMERYGSKSGSVSAKVIISNCGELQ